MKEKQKNLVQKYNVRKDDLKKVIREKNQLMQDLERQRERVKEIDQLKSVLRVEKSNVEKKLQSTIKTLQSDIEALKNANTLTQNRSNPLVFKRIIIEIRTSHRT